MVVNPAVLQVFSSDETIETCWDRRRMHRRMSIVGWSPEIQLLFRECFVIGVETVVAIMTVVVYISVVVILL